MITRLAVAVLVLSAAACNGGTEPANTGTDPANTNEERAAGETHMAFVQAGRDRLRTVPEPMRGSIETWYNSTGLAQLDPTVWQTRLDRACAREFWANPVTLRLLGDEFAAADSVFPIKTPGMGRVEMQGAYSALWVMALNHCREIIPPEVIAGRPPDFNLDD